MKEETNGNRTELLTEEAEPEIVPMDDAFIDIVLECRRAAQTIEAQAQGALILFLRQHDLKGEWRIAESGRELIRRQ